MSILRPKVNVLNESYKEQILSEAKDILENLGVFIENQEAVEMLKKKGLNNEGDKFFNGDTSEFVVSGSIEHLLNEIILQPLFRFDFF